MNYYVALKNNGKVTLRKFNSKRELLESNSGSWINGSWIYTASSKELKEGMFDCPHNPKLRNGGFKIVLTPDQSEARNLLHGVYLELTND